MEFEWTWCDQCEIAIVICPKCGNNCCNGMYGPAEGTVKDNWNPDIKEKCVIYPLAYQYADLAYQTESYPILKKT